MSLPFDITVASRSRRTILAVECQYSLDASPVKAARLRNRLCTDYVDVPSDSFFMLAMPYTFYLWRPGVALDAPPNYSAEAQPILRIYLGDLAVPPQFLFMENMRFAVSLWLGDLAASMRNPGEYKAEDMLVDVGLYDLMRGGTVERGYTL